MRRGHPGVGLDRLLIFNAGSTEGRRLGGNSVISSFKPERLQRYKEIARLLIRHGRKDLFGASGLDRAVVEEEIAEAGKLEGDPEELADDLEELGPTFIKLGQVLAARPDLISLSGSTGAAAGRCFPLLFSGS